MRYLVRFAPELVLKSDKIRARFVTRMMLNLRAAAAYGAPDIEIDRQWTRLYVTSAHAGVEVALDRVFGIASWSKIEHECAPDLQAIIDVGTAAYKDAVKGKTFAVRARRAGTHAFSSLDVSRELGGNLWQYAAKVDLKHPKVEIKVEVRDTVAYLFSAVHRGAGGCRSA